jgi:tetratricopeptide (TPR) repeat protein
MAPALGGAPSRPRLPVRLSNLRANRQQPILANQKNARGRKERLGRHALVLLYEPSVTGSRMRSRALTFNLLILFVLYVASLAACRPAFGEDYLDYYEQGEFALRVQKWDSAIDLFTKSIQDNPNFFVAYHNRAIAYSKKGEYDKSIQDLRKAVELNPDYPDAYGLMGLVYEIRKDYVSALKVYREALAREKRAGVKKTIEQYIQDVEAKLK